MKTFTATEETKPVFQSMEACASTLASLIHEESLFESLLTGKDSREDLLTAYFFNDSFDEEMLEWSSFFEEILGDDIGQAIAEEGSTDEQIQGLLQKLTDAVSRLNGMDIDREGLVALSPEKNPFHRYGFEALEDSLKRFHKTYVSLQ